MSSPHIIMWAVALAVGIPSFIRFWPFGLRNPTAGALVLCWLFSEGLYWLTGDGLAVEYFAYPDVFVIAVIMSKPEYCSFDVQPSWLHELKCLLMERSPSDRFILCSYPFVWWLYVADIHPYYQYWGLWWLAVAQFLAAGGESLQKFRGPRSVQQRPDPPDNVLLFPVHRRTAEAAAVKPLLVARGVGGDG